jgi:hypothetical protein
MQRVGVRSVFFWFIVFNLPAALAFSARIVWDNSVVGDPTTTRLMLRILVAIIMFSITQTLFGLKLGRLSRLR